MAKKTKPLTDAQRQRRHRQRRAQELKTLRNEDARSHSPVLVQTADRLGKLGREIGARWTANAQQRDLLHWIQSELDEIAASLRHKAGVTVIAPRQPYFVQGPSTTIAIKAPYFVQGPSTTIAIKAPYFEKGPSTTTSIKAPSSQNPPRGDKS